MAERYWGLLRADGTPKLAFSPFMNGMLSEKKKAEAPALDPVPAEPIEPGT